MSYFVYFDNNKQSFKFLKAEENTSLVYSNNKFTAKKTSANTLEQILINGDDKTYNNYTIFRASITDCSYKITGYVQVYVDIYTYNDIEWTFIVNDGIKQYVHTMNNKLSPFITIPINIYSNNLEKVTIVSSVPFKTLSNNTFINLIVEQLHE